MIYNLSILLKLGAIMAATEDKNLVEKFTKATDKAAFILSDDFNKNIYSLLVRTVLLRSDQRKKIAEELVRNRAEYDFDALIRKLSMCCFEQNKDEFIRKGNADFLSDILQILAKQTDSDFAAKCKKALDQSTDKSLCAFPQDFKLSDTLGGVLFRIYTVAQEFASDRKDDKYIQNLPQNLIIKLFNPLLLIGVDFSLLPPFNQWNTTMKQEANEYIKVRLMPENYMNKKELEKIHLAIDRISNLIKDSQWELGGLGLFKGGVSVKFDGKMIRVPHRVAAMATLINQFETAASDHDIVSLYKQIKEKAKEALDAPRSGQKKGTKLFYCKVINDFYCTEQIRAVPNDAKSKDTRGERFAPSVIEETKPLIK